MSSSISRASFTDPGSALLLARRSRWWAPSGIMMIFSRSLFVRKTPPPLHGSIKPLLNTMFEAPLSERMCQIIDYRKTIYLNNLLKSGSTVYGHSCLFIGSDAELFVAIIRECFEIPFYFRKHIVMSAFVDCRAHRHNHFSACLKWNYLIILIMEIYS